MKNFSALLLLLVTVLPMQLAAEELNYNLIQLSGSADQEVDNDILVVTLTAQAEEKTAARAASRVNSDMEWALAQVKGVAGLKVNSLGYQTSPRYKNQVITGWHARQQLRLESATPATLSTLVGSLQEKLQVASMAFEISPEKRAEIQKRLIAAALKSFQQKADLIVQTLTAKEYRLVSLHVQEEGGMFHNQNVFRVERMAKSLAAAPAIAPGGSTITVRVEGTIQLSY